MTILEFVNILVSCCPNTYHDKASKEKPEYIVWHEAYYQGYHADNVRIEEPKFIAVDLLTKNEFSDIPDRLRTAFEENSIAYRGPEIIYNLETDYRQFAYTCEVL